MGSGFSYETAKLAGTASFALSFGFAWHDLMGHSVALAQRNDQLASYGLNGHTLFLLGMIAAALAAVLFTRFLARRPLAVVCSCGAVGIFATLLCCTTDIAVAHVASTVVVGASVVVVLWHALICLCRLADKRLAVFCAVVALLGKGWIAMTLNALPGQIFPAAIVFVAAIGTASCCLALRAGFAGDGLDDKPVVQVGPRTRGVAIAVLLLSGLVFAATRTTSLMGYWGSDYVLSHVPLVAELVASILFVLLCHFSLVRTTGSNVLFRFLPALLVLIASCSALLTGWFDYIGFPDALTGVLWRYTELYGNALDWAVLLFLLQFFPADQLRVQGAQCLCFSVSSIGFQELQDVAGTAGTATALVVLYAAFVILIVMLYRTYASCGIDGDSGGANAGGTDKVVLLEGEARLAIAEVCGLTDREREVFFLLAQGRSRSFICEELSLAAGTVGTYTDRVYRKLGVHSKQELLSVVLNEAQCLSGLNEASR